LETSLQEKDDSRNKLTIIEVMDKNLKVRQDEWREKERE